MNEALETVAKHNCSIEVAECLLKNGADVDGHPRGHLDDYASPLYLAAQRNTRSASQLMKFPLESGTDPLCTWAGKSPGDQRGAKNLSKWLRNDMG